MFGNNVFNYSDTNLDMIQSNMQQNVNQSESVQGFAGAVMNIQGFPNGFNSKMANMSIA